MCSGKRFVADEARGEASCSRCGLVRPLPPVADAARPAAAPVARASQARLPRRLRTQQQRRGEAGNAHRLRLAQEEARRLAAALGCPADVGERAAKLLRRARQARLTQGRDFDALAPAALLVSCRALMLARTEREVAAASKVPWRRIQAASRSLVRGLGLRVPTLTAKQYIGQVASAAGLGDAVQAAAYRFLEPVCGTSAAAGKSPLGWSAAALLLAARERGEEVSVAGLARAAGVSTSTLLARVEDLRRVGGQARGRSPAGRGDAGGA